MTNRRDRVRNRRRNRRPDRRVIVLQIFTLVGTIAFLYVFGDRVAAGAGNLVSELTDSRRAPLQSEPADPELAPSPRDAGAVRRAGSADSGDDSGAGSE